MVPLIKKSTDSLVEIFTKKVTRGESFDVFRSV